MGTPRGDYITGKPSALVARRAVLGDGCQRGVSVGGVFVECG